MRAAALGALLFVTTACGAPRLAGEAPARTPDPAVEPPPGATRWDVRASIAERTHRLDVEADLRSRVDSVERVDSLRATMHTTWTFARAPRGAREVPARIAGTITDYRVAFGNDAPLAPVVGLRLPLLYAAEQAALEEQPRLTLPGADECAPSGAALVGLRELWASLPETLFEGLSWADSAEYGACRDSVPVTVRSVRTYRVLDVEPQPRGMVAHVERRSAVRLSGAGTQFGEPLQLEGEGEGMMRLLIALEGGAILSGAGESELRLTMQGRRRQQSLVQRARITISVP